jgi:pimeloyl-ACP methyl ester carboxylesterase
VCKRAPDEAAARLLPPVETKARLVGSDYMGAVGPEGLSVLTMPVVFLAGELDAIIPIELIERAQYHAPRSRFVPIPNAGHSVYWELPDQFNSVLE